MSLFMAYIRVRDFAWQNRLSKRFIRAWALRRVQARGLVPRKLSRAEDRVLLILRQARAYEHALAHGFYAAVKTYKLPVSRKFFDWESVKCTITEMDTLKRKLIVAVSAEDHQRLREWQEFAGVPSLSEEIWKNVMRPLFHMDKLEALHDRLKELLGGQDHEPRTLPDELERPRDADGCVPYRISAGAVGWSHGGTHP